ncbi:23S rRNA (adenine(1618)-N(6))-methyltransferase RlmF [Shewanella waksmanii]|uniref:23S rRNA (adenine(1618)-N(6))-methyltransferase RlmF n=1 Tax=Shewanella waksmanii TaxID=213783 RepID=UPI0037363E4A
MSKASRHSFVRTHPSEKKRAVHTAKAVASKKHAAATSASHVVPRGDYQIVPAYKTGLHPRNIHNQDYDFSALVAAFQPLKAFVRPNPYGKLSIDFADAEAVKHLNAALLKHHYQIDNWDIPAGFLCPPIPGRVDYLHYLADLLTERPLDGQNVPSIPKRLYGHQIKLLDIGTGANGIYPLLGNSCYGWQFVASDIDPVSVKNVQQIAKANPKLTQQLSVRLQDNRGKIFDGIIAPKERFDVTLCNPPFHASLAEATKGTQRKLTNLAANRAAKGHQSSQATSKLNFGGQKAELWCEGGERRFLLDMISQSKPYAAQCLWFTSLVSKKENLKPCYQALESMGAVAVKTINMAQGNKQTRILAWSYLDKSQRVTWSKLRALIDDR